MKRQMMAALLLVAGMSTLSARTPGQQPEGYPAVGAPGTVKLISAGAAPKTLLRYAVPVGTKERMDMTMSVGMSMEMAGAAMPSMTLPGMKMGADLAVTDVSAAGDITYAINFNGMSVDGNADPAIVAAMQTMADTMKVVKGTVTITNRGVARANNMDFSKVTDSQLGQMMGSMTSTLNNMSMPLPEEEVGVGARWEARLAINANGVTMYQKTEFEVVAVDGKTVTLKTRITQTAPAQAISNPAMPPGAAIQLVDMKGSGLGTALLRLNGLVPTSDGTVDSTMVMAIDMGGVSQQMAVTTSMKMIVAPGK